jgi:RimJ/RimL family protein N-acetyltransferase
MIETERLVLRMPRLEDADAALEFAADPEVMHYMGGVDPSLDGAGLVRLWLRRWDAHGFGQFAVERREDGRFLGRVGIVVWDSRDWRLASVAEAGEHAQPELGWALAREHWGQGYATEAALATREWVRDETSIDRLISLINPENARSAAVATKLGAAVERTVQTTEGPASVWVHPR